MVTGDEANDNWVINLGCTHHMTCCLDWFTEFSEIQSTKILLGGFHTVETLGIGTVMVNAHGGSVKMMQNVIYVPSLWRNLISTRTLDKLTFKHSGGGGKIMFTKNSKLVLQGTLKNGMYILDGELFIQNPATPKFSS